MSSNKTESEWLEILIRCGVRATTAARWTEAFSAECHAGAFSAGEAEIPDFLGQVLHESARLERMEEGLSYASVARLREVWPKRFQTDESAAPFVRNPVGLANRVYGGRMGNDGPNDGWLYRGSGPIAVTGKDNFAALEAATGLPLVRSPDLLRRPGPEALRVCIAWWEGNVPDAVMGNVAKVRRAVNGGLVGLADADALTDAARDALA